MQELTQQTTIQAAFDAHPSEDPLELIGGKIVEMVSNNRSSAIAIKIATHLQNYIDKHKVAARLTGADGGFKIGDDRYMPDVAYMSIERYRQYKDAATEHGFFPAPPELAVEVLSPTDQPAHVRIKIGNYLAVGSQVWVIDPELQTVEWYIPNQKVIELSADDSLTSGELLPNFSVSVKQLFPLE